MTWTNGQTLDAAGLNSMESRLNFAPPMATGRWYAPFNHQGLTSSAVSGNNEADAMPYPIGANVTLTGIGADVATAGESGATIRLALYSDIGGMPGALLLDTGTVAADTTGFKSFVISLPVTIGWYWAVLLAQNAVTTRPAMRTYQQGTSSRIGDTTGGSASSKTGYFSAPQAGACPDPFGTPSGTRGVTVVPVIWLKAG